MNTVQKGTMALLWLAVAACGLYSIVQGRLLSATGWLFGAAMGASAMLTNFAPPRKKEEPKEEALPPPDKQQSLALFRQKYGEMLSRLDIAENGGLVGKMSSLFSLLGCSVQHFCWKDSGRLYFFAQWDSLEKYFAQPEFVKPYKQGDENNLYLLDIPLERIDYFKKGEDYPSAQNPEKLEKGMVVLQYYNAVNQLVMLLFSAESFPVFQRLMPEKEYKVMLTQKYPKSARQSLYVRDQLQALKELWKQGLMNDEDFSEKRKILLALL